MATVNAHTGILTSPKFVPLSDGAFRLWWHGLLWSKEHLTDGFIPSGMLLALHRRAEKLVDELLRVNVPGKGPLWHADVDGYRIHDYVDWQDSATAVQTRRRKWRAQKQGLLKPSTPESTPESTAESTPESTAESTPESTAESTPDSQAGGGGGGGNRSTNAKSAFVDARPPDHGELPTRKRRLAHAWEARRPGLGVPHTLHRDLLSKMAIPDESALIAWYGATEAAWQGRAIGDTVWDFWNARFSEWQGTTTATAKAAGLAAGARPAHVPRTVAVVDPDYQGATYRFHCGHRPTCTTWPQHRALLTADEEASA